MNETVTVALVALKWGVFGGCGWLALVLGANALDRWVTRQRRKLHNGYRTGR